MDNIYYMWIVLKAVVGGSFSYNEYQKLSSETVRTLLLNVNGTVIATTLFLGTCFI